MKDEHVLFHATVVFLIRGNKVLLGRKTRKIGEGRFNGPGGGIEEGENSRESAVRETFEETGIKILPDKLEKTGFFYLTLFSAGLIIKTL